ncbi:hypothetical protein Zmor_003196 [Zophobas morio]|uniref:Uncharacterized protein n=1 Tax=Zophobas morio TaxID=2755281 RepID=A0AA38M130_9CUCU|nr:hypothetical protein Zmor_003196 [Zophobas morio]
MKKKRRSERIGIRARTRETDFCCPGVGMQLDEDSDRGRENVPTDDTKVACFKQSFFWPFWRRFDTASFSFFSCSKSWGEFANCPRSDCMELCQFKRVA